VAGRAHHAVDDVLHRTTGTVARQRSDVLDGAPVDSGEPDRVVAEAGAPVQVRPPCGRVDHHGDTEPPTEREVELVVGRERSAAASVVEQRDAAKSGRSIPCWYTSDVSSPASVIASGAESWIRAVGFLV
jgi:hypothetical protein